MFTIWYHDKKILYAGLQEPKRPFSQYGSVHWDFNQSFFKILKICQIPILFKSDSDLDFGYKISIPIWL